MNRGTMIRLLHCDMMSWVQNTESVSLHVGGKVVYICLSPDPAMAGALWTGVPLYILSRKLNFLG